MTTAHSLGWIGILFVVVVMACATTGPPQELLARHDHGGFATWYDQEAARRLGKAEEMRGMAQEYAKPSYQPSPKESKAQLMAHCQLFTEYYTKAAEEATALARLHREQDKAIPIMRQTTSLRLVTVPVPVRSGGTPEAFGPPLHAAERR